MKQKISKKRLNEIVKKTVTNFLQENYAVAQEIYPEVEQEPLLEMARINKKETGKSVFPFDAWEVKIWSNDREPAHFHVIRDGWNVSFSIEDGKLLNINSMGAKQEVFEYMTKNIQTWLSSQCAAQPKLQNRENAMLQWEQLH